MEDAATKGLSESEAQKLLAEYGKNVFVEKKKLSPLFSFVKKFSSPLVLLLVGVSAVSIFMGQHTDAVIILIMVFISAILDFFNTHKSEKAVAELVARVAITAKVVRDGMVKDISIKYIVPGDVVQLSAGDIVPADARVLAAKDFFVNQSALTGESFPIEKVPAAVGAQNESSDKAGFVYMGSNVVTGFAQVEVMSTGSKTQYGAIVDGLHRSVPETDFERGIRKFSYLILQITFVLVGFVFFANTLMHRGLFESFVFALAIAIGLTPELLPVVISIGLSHGSVQMSKKDVIVKNLSSIQNFGSMNILCTDKTGTLTEDRIALVKYVDGFGADSEKVLLYSYINSYFHSGISNPLDNAIKDFRHLDIVEYNKIDEVPFDFLRRRASIVVNDGKKNILITKGAPESVYPVCTKYCDADNKIKAIDSLTKEKIDKEFDLLSGEGFRVLAVAYREVGDKKVYEKDEECDLVFMGFVAFLDPPKATADSAIRELEDLGIEVKILTGDSEVLTGKICRDINLVVKGVLTGEQIEKMSEMELERVSHATTIFARINPAQKERIILALKKTGCSVGYLGDGINDAPALKAADVGISVNNAVDVAKDTADIILLKKSLHVLRDGVVEGRRTFQNTMKYIMMGLSSNFGNMFSMAGLPLFVPFFPMLPSQILLNNLMYDVSQFTLPTDNVDEQDLKKPLRWDMRFIRKYMLVFGTVSSIFDFVTFILMWYVFVPTVAQFQTAWFIESLATQTLVIFIIRTRRVPFLQSNPSGPVWWSALAVVLLGWVIPFTFFGNLMRFQTLSWSMMFVLVLLVIGYLVLVQFIKMLFYRYVAKKHFAVPKSIC